MPAHNKAAREWCEGSGDGRNAASSSPSAAAGWLEGKLDRRLKHLLGFAATFAAHVNERLQSSAAARHSIGARQPGKVLTKRMSGNEPVKVILLVKVVRIVIPATEVGAGSRHPLTLAKRFEQPILVEMKEQFMVLVELQTEGPVQELHI